MALNMNNWNKNVTPLFEKKIADQVFGAEDTPFLNFIQGYGKVDSGANTFQKVIRLQESPNVKSFVGDDLFDSAEQTGNERIVVNASNLYALFAVSGTDIDESGSPQDLVGLIQDELDSLQKTAARALNSQFLADGTGNGGKDFDGLDLIIGTGAYGGITPGAGNDVNSLWKSTVINRTSVGAGFPAAADIYDDLQDLTEGIAGVTRGVRPQAIFVSRPFARVYREAYHDILVANIGDPLDLGVDAAATVDGIPMYIEDELGDASTGTVFAVHAKDDFRLRKNSKAWGRVGNLNEDNLKDMFYQKITWRGQLWCVRRNSQGRINYA